MEIDSLRQIDELGRVVLPLEFRRALSMSDKQLLRIIVKEDHLELYPVEKQ